jgi:uncharacterized protein (TIGR00730 family)
MTRRRVCVYCGSNWGCREIYNDAAAAVGRALVARGLGLVYGGAHVGTMGVVADAVLALGGEAIGVIPRSMQVREIAHSGLTELIVVETMHERKARMTELCDAFVVLPGAYGTLDELFEALTWLQLGVHAKPVGVLNVLGYFDTLLTFLDHAAGERFLKKAHRALLLSDADPDALLDRLGMKSG